MSVHCAHCAQHTDPVDIQTKCPVHGLPLSEMTRASKMWAHNGQWASGPARIDTLAGVGHAISGVLVRVRGGGPTGLQSEGDFGKMLIRPLKKFAPTGC
jgi:hypothetical protein